MRSLKSKIMLPVFIMAALGFLLVSYVGEIVSREVIINYVKHVGRSKVEKLTVKVEDMLNEWKSSMKILSTTEIVESMDFERFKKYHKENINLFEQYEVLFMSDLNGDFLATNDTSGNIKDRDYFYKALDGHTVISKPLISKSTNNYIVIVAVPIINDEGRIIGLIGGTVNLSVITEIINSEKFENNGYAIMIDKSGVTMSHPNKDLLFKDNVLENEDIKDIGIKMISNSNGVEYYDYKGEDKIIAYKKIDSTGWTIGMTLNYKEATKGVIDIKYYILFIGIITTLSITLSLYFLTSSLVKPINRLKGFMEEATKGDLTIKSDIDSNDEIGVLSKSFNKLITENNKLLEEAIEYDKLKTEFFSNISHELKTPLNIIFSMSQLISVNTKDNTKEFDTIKLNKNISIIKQNCYRLLRLVNNLIDITRISSGYIEMNLKNRNIVEIVENITLSTVEYVESKSRVIVFDTDIEEKIMAIDVDKIERIMLNLISNAIKFTKPNDEIIVNIYDKGDNIEISIQDTGIGISEEKQEIIFERFRQVDALYNRNHEGSGIGLSLVKSLIEMHSGNIKLKSKIGVGTEFIIELPVKLVQEELRKQDNLIDDTKVEKIQVEFSDIYE